MKPFKLLVSKPDYGIKNYHEILDKLFSFRFEKYYYPFISDFVFVMEYGSFLITSVRDPTENRIYHIQNNKVYNFHYTHHDVENLEIYVLFFPILGRQFYLELSRPYDPELFQYTDNLQTKIEPLFTETTIEDYLGPDYNTKSRFRRIYQT